MVKPPLEPHWGVSAAAPSRRPRRGWGAPRRGRSRRRSSSTWSSSTPGDNKIQVIKEVRVLTSRP